MRISRYETTPRERVEFIRSRLRTAVTEEHALAALEPASIATLMVLETDYMSDRGPVHTLRERIAFCHAKLVERKVSMSTSNVTEEMVAGWARANLALCFGGYSDYDAAQGVQYRLDLIEHDATGMVYEVSSLAGHESRQFVITLAVAEIPR